VVHFELATVVSHIEVDTGFEVDTFVSQASYLSNLIAIFIFYLKKIIIATGQISNLTCCFHEHMLLVLGTQTI
jgi:hypothetical protein